MNPLRKYLAIAGGVALLALATWIWRIDSLRAAHLTDLIACGKAKEEQRLQFDTAQKIARDRANANKARKEAEHEKARMASNAALDDLRQRYRAVVLRKGASAAGRAAGKTGLPGNAQGAQGALGAGAGAGVPLGEFVISEADALICADNTARLQEAQRWAIEVLN